MEGEAEASSTGASDKPPKTNKIELSLAPTSRSKCQACQGSINKGEYRAAFPSRHNGLSVVRWLHPSCLLQNVRLDMAPTSRAKCKQTGDTITKTQPRLLFQKRECGDGPVHAAVIYSIAGARSIIAELRDKARLAVDPTSWSGYAELPREHGRWVDDAFAGRSLEGRSPPVVEEEKKTPAKKRAAKTTNGKASKRKSTAQLPESDEEEVELLD